jgi:hypothetical protein
MMCAHVGMTAFIEHDPAGRADDPNEDTIELLLSADERQSLSRAAAEAQSHTIARVEWPIAPPDPPPIPAANQATARSNPDLKLRWPRLPFEAATVLAVVTIALASTAYRSAKMPAPRTYSASPAIAQSSADPDPVYSAHDGEPVRVKNPFDASETFEFPPGTSAAAARKYVANLLLERGRNRLDQSLESKRASPRQAERSTVRGVTATRAAN